MDQAQSKEFDGLKRTFLQSLAEYNKLQRLLNDFKESKLTDEVLEEVPEVAAQVIKNRKLEYRINIMKRAIDEVKASGKKAKVQKPEEKKAPEVKYVKVKDYRDAVLERLTSVFSEVVEKCYPGNNFSITLRETNNLKFGDYQFDSSPMIAKTLKLKPDEVAKKIIDNLPQVDLIKSVEQAKVFINIFLNRETVGKKVSAIFAKGISLPDLEQKRVVIDFSSPNIAKQMHVGHLRSTIIGESFSRLLEYVGYDVLRLNHVGDWGTQFGMLIAHLQDKFPNFAKETPPLKDLQAFYKESKKRFDEDEMFKKRAYDCVVKLQAGDKEFESAWRLICDVSKKDYTKIYERLDVTLQERGESFYQDKMVSLVEELDKEGKLKLEEGRKLFYTTEANIPLTVVKSDGGFTYDTSDLATLKHRLFEEKANWLLYVVDRGQSEHFASVYSAARDLGWYDPKQTRVEHVQFGVVLGEDKKKFKTRSGDTVKLSDLLDEGVKRAEAKLVEKGRDKVMGPEELEAARDAVAYGCIRYADLSHGRTNDYVFSFDRMLDDRGNTAVYLLYAYARIRSIAREAKVERSAISEYVSKLPNGVLPLEHEREFKLAKQLLKFSDTLLLVLESLQLHKLCDYVYNLATVFHDFYKDCYVINKNDKGEITVNYHRLVLCEVTADTMAACFKTLGIRPIERM
ncbi:unnamed protein product [Bursaphelenchus okinawaensis]|uniref:arginine--tRNA ligase n=1 Tax=Bursaphelenchus okinawaensis TaxID=465554 RepID=A0A811K7U5_9BILA|nr:unnamed protein product [Bursaphelenchus okinawaensis]CAG9095079.1 unnamed protein product [Bursaphelenchus okinawaensis]